jgi:hypothetical protein
LKKLLFIFLLSFTVNLAFAQADSLKRDTAVKKTQRIRPPKKIIRTIIDTAKPPQRSALSDSITARIDTLKTDTLAIDTTLVQVKDTVKVLKDTIARRPLDTFYMKLLNNPYFKITGKPLYFVVSERQRNSKDEVFYILAGLLLCLALIRLGFSRYFTDIFRLFFQPTFRQKQTREQLLQGSFPSMLLNLFFVLSCGTYISFLLVHYHMVDENFWWLFLYSTIALIVLYAGKFILLTLAGWVFDVKEATETYLFAVYLINKILGVVLVPFILIIAFSRYQVTEVAITVSLLIISALFIYRYIVSFAPVRREVSVSPLHFLFYVCAFEITPLLLIYKTLVLYLSKSL